MIKKEIESGSDYGEMNLNPGREWNKEKEAFKDSPYFPRLKSFILKGGQ